LSSVTIWLPRTVYRNITSVPKVEYSTVSEVSVREGLTLWRPLSPYGYSYKTSCARPG